MNSNSKLTKAEKWSLRTAKIQNPEIQFFSFPDYFCTVAIREVFQNSRMVQIGVSWASPYEIKFRTKVGEFYALENLVYAGIVVPNNGDFYSIAQNLAEIS
jgi:hypothetical protein